VRDYLKGKRCMVWSFMGNARMYEALRDYGDRFDTVGIFTFEVDATGTITETGTSISSMLPYIQKCPFAVPDSYCHKQQGRYGFSAVKQADGSAAVA
jgi:hypothetical protein